MVSGGFLSGREPAGRTGIVHEDPRTRVTRVVVAGRTVIRKELLGPDSDRRLRHELAMLQRLRGVPGVAQLAEEALPGALVLADAGDLSLAAMATPLAVEDLVGLGLGVARAVAGMHRRGVMHRDICPANIVVGGDGVPCLVDFGLATGMAEIRPEFTPAGEIVGTLAYLAPEQTGRTGRAVDERADLYAVGATLYELATGAPPFGAGDPLRLLHDHLTRVPVAPEQVNPAVPGPLSEIILHLLEKEPDRRYQTADGLAYDLKQLRDAAEGPAGADFRVGARDVPLRLVPPSRLVDRDEQVAALEAAFDDALTGGCRGVLVAGAPGVGKTALIDQLRPAVTGRDGWFVAGKFDQYRRDLAFDAVQQAFQALGRLLLAEPDDELAEVRGRILRALGPNAGLMTAVLPEAAALLAVPPNPGDPLTAQARLQWAGVQMLRAVASRKRPVLVFLDDLQWAGRPPLGLVDLVLSAEPVDGLLLVGAHREVDAAHPLAALVTRWRGLAGVRQMRLEDLPGSGQVAMVAEMLHLNRDAAAGLAGLIAPYTRGNPYETVELLNALRQGERADRHRRRVAVGCGGGAGAPRRGRPDPAAGGPGGGAAGAVAAHGAGDGGPGRAGRAGPAGHRDRRAGGRGRAVSRTGPGQGAAGGRSGGAGSAVSPRPDPRGGTGRARCRAAARAAPGDGAAAGRHRRNCSRSRPSSTCRSSTRSPMPRSGGGW